MGWLNLLDWTQRNLEEGGWVGNDASYVFKGILHFSFLFSDPQFSEIYHYVGRRAKESPTYEVCKKGGIALLMFR